MRLEQTRGLLAERVDELVHFIAHLEETENALVASTSHSPLLPSPQVSAVMKATVLVMNYSLVEALVVELVDELYEMANSQGASLSRLSPHLRKQIVDYRFRGLQGAGSKRIQEVAIEMIDKAIADTVIDRPDKKSIRDSFLGNLDARKLRDIASKMGITLTVNIRSRGGSDLREMKDSRNQLAHGHRSFNDLGQLKTVSDLTTQTRRIVEYLLSVIRSFERGIRNGETFTIPTP